MWAFLHKLASPKYFYLTTGRWLPWLGWSCGLLLLLGLYQGLWVAPADYQQGEAYRIIFIHVPSAWLSLFIYMFMAINAAIGLVWKIKLAEIIAACSAPIGASFTFITLLTGSLWGKPMWGTYWQWDARLTSELILLFLYLGFIAIQFSTDNQRLAARASALLAIVGVVNIPIIHYSVEWWHTLHQGPTITKLSAPSIHSSMLIPLLIMTLGLKLYFVTNLLMRARGALLLRERHSQWVQELVETE